jgi:hypothetical protein
VILFKGKIPILEFSDFDLDGVMGRVNRVKLWYDFQQPKSSRIEPFFCTHVYDSIYCYFGPRFRVSAA